MVQKMAHTRIQVPVDEETLKAYQALANAQRTSLAAVCAEILQQAAPMVIQIASALETAKTAPTRALREITDSLDRVMGDANQLQIKLDDKLTPKAARRKYKRKAG